MNAWLLPASPLTEDALAFRRRWTDRWKGYVPRTGRESPEGAAYDHRHAHPQFRDPLFSTEGVDASVEFHAAVIERLATGQPVTLMTFDFEWEWEGELGREVSTLDGLLKRDPLLSMLEEPQDDEGLVVQHLHWFSTHCPAVAHPRAPTLQP